MGILYGLLWILLIGVSFVTTCSSNNQCQHGGTCTQGSCICAQGYTGDRCGYTTTATTKPTVAKPSTSTGTVTSTKAITATVFNTSHPLTQASAVLNDSSTPSVANNYSTQKSSKDGKIVLIVVLSVGGTLLVSGICIVSCYLYRRHKKKTAGGNSSHKPTNSRGSASSTLSDVYYMDSDNNAVYNTIPDIAVHESNEGALYSVTNNKTNLPDNGTKKPTTRKVVNQPDNKQRNATTDPDQNGEKCYNVSIVNKAAETTEEGGDDMLGMVDSELYEKSDVDKCVIERPYQGLGDKQNNLETEVCYMQLIG